MLSMITLGLFLFASLLHAISPGPNIIYIATRSITQGRNAGIFSALGVGTAYLVHILANVIGLSALTAASVLAFSSLKYAGAAYLIYLGIQTLLSKEGMIQDKKKEQVQLSEVFYQGLLVSLLNPHTLLFFLAFLPQFVDLSRGRITLQLLLLGVLSR